MDTKVLRGKRARKVAEMRAMVETCAKEGREFNAVERRKWDTLESAETQLKDEIERLERSDPLVGPTAMFGPDLGDQRMTSDSVALRSDQKFSDWVRANGLQREYDEPMSLAKLVRGWISPDARRDFTESEHRALAEGTDSAGGFAVPEPLSARLIDNLRQRSVALRLGATTVPMTSQTLSIARLAADPQGAWRNENSPVASDDAVFESVTFTARSWALLVQASRELLEDNAVGLQSELERVFAAQMGLAIDQAALEGSGTAPEPEGLANIAGVGSVVLGTGNGGELGSYTPILDARRIMLTANALEPTGFVSHPRTDFEIADFTDANGQPLARPPAIADLPVVTSTGIPVDETLGTATDASHAFLGVWSDLLIGMRTQVTLTLVERFSDLLQIGFIAHVRGDIQVAHPESFVKISGIIPPP